MNSEKKASHPLINALKTEWQFLGRRKGKFLLYICFFLIAGAIGLATPFVVGSIFNDIQRSITTSEEMAELHIKIALLLVITIVYWIFHGIGRLMETRTGFFVRRSYVNDKISKVLDLPARWHKDHHSGDTIDKINRASSSLEDFSSHLTFQITYAAVNFLGSIIIMFFIDWKIGIFALVYSLLVIAVIVRIDSILDEKYRKINKFNNRYAASVYDYLSNVMTVITLRLKKVVCKEIDSRQIMSYPTYKKSSLINEIKWAFASIAIEIMIVLALMYRSSTEFVLTGTILIGTLYMVYSYLRQVGETFYRFAELYGQIVRQNANIVGAYPLDDAYNKLSKDAPERLPADWRKISFNDVSFTYDEKGKIKHLDHIDFHFSRKQKIALIGESGSGKSTILALVRGLYRIENGRAYCDGKPLHGVVGIRDHVTLIPQEPEIFNKTIRYNITMNLPVDDSDLEQAIEMARLRPVIQRLPSGLDTNVLERGVSLSGGEKQRLALARGLLAAKDSDILLLDEPTSSVDSTNETMIYDRIFSKFKNKTIICSVHRLHLLHRFDYIFIFSNGKIMSEGKYEDIKRNPIFRKMMSKYTKAKRPEKRK